ncbi:MAG: glycerol-3-phosphate acyltransferase PlsX [Pseudohongiellaceae bacterium]
MDAMGGDHAPRAVLEGVALAVAEGGVDPASLVLVGRDDAVTPLLDELSLQSVETLHAAEVIGMDEAATAAVRSKRDSSISVGMAEVAKGLGDAFVSAGNTGAVVAAASVVLGRTAGVHRPGIAVPMPTPRGPCVVIDVGANIFCKPEHLLQYSIMASEYCRAIFHKPEPLVGLLNIGAEEGKGGGFISETHALLQEADINYRGFIEGQDILSGVVDVVVCEGFVGNVILKVSEGIARFVGHQVHNAFAQHPPRDEVKLAVSEAFASLDYAEYGGAPLLGVSAPVLIGHGRSSPHAIMNMIRAAGSVVEYGLNRHIADRLAAQNGGSSS